MKKIIANCLSHLIYYDFGGITIRYYGRCLLIYFEASFSMSDIFKPKRIPSISSIIAIKLIIYDWKNCEGKYSLSYNLEMFANFIHLCRFSSNLCE